MNKQTKPSTLKDLQNVVEIVFHDHLHHFCNTLIFYVLDKDGKLNELQWENFHNDSLCTANLGPINQETILPILKIMRIITDKTFIKTKNELNTTIWTRKDYLERSKAKTS